MIQIYIFSVVVIFLAGCWYESYLGSDDYDIVLGIAFCWPGVIIGLVFMGLYEGVITVGKAFGEAMVRLTRKNK
jgi:hypothetical protein